MSPVQPLPRAGSTAGAPPRARGHRDPLWVALAAFASRLPYLVPVEQDLDGSRFVRGVLGFDLARHHPHPPGYPVYVGAATALDRALVHQPALSLSVVSALGFALLAGVTAALARALCERGAGPPPDAGGTLAPRVAGLVAPALLALGTSVAVHATRPLSDMLGAALGWACVLAAARLGPATEAIDPRAAGDDRPAARGAGAAAALAGVALFALLCGARLSVVPLALPALVACARAARRAGRTRDALLVGLVAGAAWLVPLLAATGARAWVQLTLGQTAGHFTEFGGSAVTQPDARVRAGAVLFGLWAHVLGGAWSDRAAALWVSSAATVALVALGAAPLAARVRGGAPAGARAFALGAGLYAAWVCVGQNVVWQPRHLMPLAPAFAVTAALGAARLAARARSTAALALGLGLALALFAPLAREAHRVAWLQARTAPPAVRVADYLARAVPPETALVASHQLTDWLRFHAPLHRVRRVRDAREAVALATGARLAAYATSEVPGAWDLAPPPREVFRATADRYVCSTLYDLSLLRLRDAPP